MPVDHDQLLRVRRNARQLFSMSEVDAAVETLAQKLTDDYADKDPVFLVIMNGGVVFAGRLLPLLDFPLEQDYLHASRYLGETSGGAVQWLVTPSADLAGRHVVILDDILDHGTTLVAIVEACQAQGAASVATAVLVDKRHDRKAQPGLKATYTGLEAEDAYLFGCGMDYKNYWRNAAGIFAVEPS
jgi:hypoxanthine phosphoribosyltransferase